MLRLYPKQSLVVLFDIYSRAIKIIPVRLPPGTSPSDDQPHRYKYFRLIGKVRIPVRRLFFVAGRKKSPSFASPINLKCVLTIVSVHYRLIRNIILADRKDLWYDN